MLDGDREARDWFVATTASLGCSTKVDSMVMSDLPFCCAALDKLMFIIVDAGQYICGKRRN